MKAATLRQDYLGRNGDVRVASEVLDIEGKDAAYLMNLHCCDQTSVMRILSQDFVSNHEMLPGNLQRKFWQEVEKPLQAFYIPESPLRSEAEAVFR